MALQYHVPEGRIDRKYNSIPALAAITPDKIRVSAGAMSHTAKIFLTRLEELGADLTDVGRFIEQRITDAIRDAIVRGIVISNNPIGDASKDRQLDIYTYVDLFNIDIGLQGIAKMKVLCRYSPTTAALFLRGIQRDFTVSK